MEASKLIDKQIADLKDWRGKLLAQLRKCIHSADPEITEEWKWDTGVWTHNGMVCATSAFKDHVKINFFQGAALTDKYKLFNGGLDSKKHRSIDFFEKDTIDEKKVIDLIHQAVNVNLSKGGK